MFSWIERNFKFEKYREMGVFGMAGIKRISRIK
jgi:hypothetical protein